MIPDDLADHSVLARKEAIACIDAFREFVGLSPGEPPSGSWLQVAAFIQHAARTQSYVLKYRWILRRYLQWHAGVDIQKEPEFVPTLEAIFATAAHGRNRSTIHAIIEHEARGLIEIIPSYGTGFRDREMMLLAYFRGVTAVEQQNMRYEHLELEYMDEKGNRAIGFTAHGINGKQRYISLTEHPQMLLCPVQTLLSWLLEANITAGPVFPSTRRPGLPMHHHTVTRIMQSWFGRAGLPTFGQGAKSLFYGMLTSAILRELDDAQLMVQVGLRSFDTIDELKKRSGRYKMNTGIRRSR